MLFKIGCGRTQGCWICVARNHFWLIRCTSHGDSLMWGDELGCLGGNPGYEWVEGTVCRYESVGLRQNAGVVSHNKSNVWGWGMTSLEGDSRVKDM